MGTSAKIEVRPGAADLDQNDQATMRERKESSSRTLLEALASAIDGTDEAETRRLAAEFNDSFGKHVRASIGVESVNGDSDGTSLGQRNPPIPVVSSIARKPALGVEPNDGTERHAARTTVKSVTSKKKASVSSDGSDSQKYKKKKKRLTSSRKKNTKVSESSSDSSSMSDSSIPSDESSVESSDVDRAELCYDITDFESADLPDLPDKWDKGFRKLRTYVPLTLFRPALLESFHEDDVEMKTKDKSALSKVWMKALEKKLTYGDFIEMCDLEERYAREIYGLVTYADYVVKHKKIVSDLKKQYNCWMIGLRYHSKVRTVIFRRRKLVKTKVKGRTVIQDTVKIPNGLQQNVERQARHDADRAGDLQYVDNPYAPGGAKFSYNFVTGRPTASGTIAVVSEKPKEGSATIGAGLRGKRGMGFKKPYMKRFNYTYQHYGRQGAPFEQAYGQYDKLRTTPPTIAVEFSRLT